MIMALRAPVLRSLQGKFLLLLVLGGTAAAATAAWFTYRTTVAQLETQLEQRARLFANTVNHAAMVSTTSFAVQHVIEEVIGDEPDFLTVIAAASKNRSWRYYGDCFPVPWPGSRSPSSWPTTCCDGTS